MILSLFRHTGKIRLYLNLEMSERGWTEHTLMSWEKKKPKQPKVHSQEDPNTTFVWGLGRYLPNPAESEDERSIEIHIQSLEREYRKANSDVNMQLVDTKMNLTFPHRRQTIVTNKTELQELIETFPWLQSYQEVYKNIFYWVNHNISETSLINTDKSV